MLEKVVGSNYFKFFFFGLCFAILFSKSDRVFGWTNVEAKSNEPIMSDGSGYYAYLPQWFTYHTSHFEFAGSITKKYPNSRFTDFAGHTIENRINYNKYYCGSALGLVPFYWIAQIHAKSISVPNDGYSWPFLLWTNIGLIFFSLLGGIGLLRLSQSYNVKRWIAYLVLTAIVFGTNLNYYTTVEIPFSHVFCFAINTWVLVFAKEWADKNKKKSFYWLSALIGWTIIIRPTNLFIIIAIPFLFKSTRSFVDRIKELFIEKRIQLMIGVLLALVFISFHLWNLWLQTGSFTLNSYANETFSHWKNPEIWNVLFSWKKGFFVYTPLMILLFPAVIVCFKKERRLLWAVLLIFSLITYMTASWWIWWFGGGLGARNYIDFMAIFGLLIMLLIHYSHWILKVLFCALAIVFVWVYGIYDYQMRNAILHYDKMTASTFKEVFLQTGKRFAWYVNFKFDTRPLNAKNMGPVHSFSDMNNHPIMKNRILESKFDDFGDNPAMKGTPLPGYENTRGSDKFGLELNIETRIYDHFTSPTAEIYVFRKDKTIEKKSYLFGGKIPSENKFHDVRLFFNTKSRCMDIDSVGLIIYDGFGNMGFRNPNAQFYTYR